MAWVEKRATGYRGRYKDAKGRSQTAEDANGRQVFGSKRAAQQAAQEAEARVRNGTWIDPKAGQITFGEYFLNTWLPSQSKKELNTRLFRQPTTHGAASSPRLMERGTPARQRTTRPGV
jgi:hypothetical protein